MIRSFEMNKEAHNKYYHSCPKLNIDKIDGLNGYG